MKSPLDHAHMSALAYLYDNLCDLPAWLGKLAPAQLQDIASVMTRWQLPNQSHSIAALDEIERREALRAVALCNGNVTDAAKALNIGKTTLYKKLSLWGYSVHNRQLHAQASVLGGDSRNRRDHFW
jgi:DNA-binding NtrC family response regulator